MRNGRLITRNLQFYEYETDEGIIRKVLTSPDNANIKYKNRYFVEALCTMTLDKFLENCTITNTVNSKYRINDND